MRWFTEIRLQKGTKLNILCVTFQPGCDFTFKNLHLKALVAHVCSNWQLCSCLWAPQMALNIFFHLVIPIWNSVGTPGALKAEDSQLVAEGGQELNIWQEWPREKGDNEKLVLVEWFKVIFSWSNLWPESQTANSKHQAVYEALFLYVVVNVGDFQMWFSGHVPHYLQECFHNSLFWCNMRLRKLV